MKNPMTPAGIEPATFRFVAQHLNHCATAVPQVLASYIHDSLFICIQRNYDINSYSHSFLFKLAAH